MLRRAAFLGLVLCACGGGVSATTADDAGPDSELRTYRPEGGVEEDASGPKFTYHGGRVLEATRVAFVYVDDESAGGAPSFDAFADQLFVSSQWASLQEYGVKSGVRTTSVRVAKADLLPATAIDAQGLIDQPVFAEAVKSYLHPSSGPRFPDANGVVVFLPAGVNVILGQRGSYKWKTCWDADAFHSTDGVADPYIVIPPCPNGRRTVALSHELGEMATDPEVYTAWYADAEQFRSGGEVSDLCDKENAVAFGFEIARYWSETKRRCVP